VTRVLQKVYPDFPYLLAVVGVIAEMKKRGWASIPASSAQPGDVATYQASPGGFNGHIGFVTRAGADPTVLSNSSARAAFTGEYAWHSTLRSSYPPGYALYWRPK
jgi:hypothetical protein